MSRLDHHVRTVRMKMAAGAFLRAWVWTSLGLAVLVWVAIVTEKALDRVIPHGAMLFWIGAAATAVAAWVWTLIRMPTDKAAAVAIDQALGLKTKFSTALYVRGNSDPFAQAAVMDAETAATRVEPAGQFPIRVPWQIGLPILAFFGAWLTSMLMPAYRAAAKPGVGAVGQVRAEGDSNALKNQLAKELPTIEQGSKLLSSNDEIRRADQQFKDALQTKDGDDPSMRRSALSALDKYHEAVKEELQRNQAYLTALDQKQAMSALPSAEDDSTPMGKAQNELKAGNLAGAVADITKAVNDFNSQKPEDQKKTADQAEKLADALAQAASDPKVAEKMAQQLMQAGATQTQAQQMVQQMRQAAAGNQQAAQQVQQTAQQITQQMNNGQGPTPQQSQQIQSLMAQAQSMANSQAQAQKLAQGAQQVAQAMSQSSAQSSAQSQSNAAPSHSGQMASPQSAQQQGQGNPQQASSAQQGGSQSGSQQQAMSAGQQSMQQQLSNMQAAAKDAAAMQQAADAAAQAAQDAAAGLAPQGGDQSADGSNSQQPNANNQPNNGQANAGQPGGQGGMGRGGAKMDIAAAPFHFKTEVDPSVNNDSGAVLASRMVKAGVDPGQSTQTLHDAAAAAEHDAPDEIDQDHVPREAQQAEKDYFSAIQQKDAQ